jgi:hypothetical protein
MKLGFWNLKVTAGIGDTRNQPIWHAYLIRSANPVWTFLPSGSPLSAMKSPTHKDQYMTVSSWVSISFYSRVFGFYPTDDASGRYKMVLGPDGHYLGHFCIYYFFPHNWKKFHRILQLILCIGFHGLRLLHKLFTSLSILVLGLCMLYNNLYCVFSYHLPSTNPGLKYLHSCNDNDMGCPVIEVSSFWRIQQSRCLTWGRKQITFPKHCVVLWIADDGQCSKT